MAASILLLNPNRHRASDKLTKSANRNPVENNMRRNQKQQQKQKPNEGKKQTLTSVTCS
jgi:hypothetical protein